MKRRGKLVFFVILFLLLVIFGIDIFKEYLHSHQYYNEIFRSGTNRKIFLSGLLTTIFPLGYLLLNQKFSLKKFLFFLGGGLIVFGLLYARMKGVAIGGTAIFMTMINTILLYALGIFSIATIYGLGEFLSSKILTFKQLRFQEIFLNFGLGLSAFLLTNWILMGLGFFHWIIVWLLAIGGGFLLYIRRKSLAKTTMLINDFFQQFYLSNINKDPRKIIFLLLIGFSIIYYYFGFQLSFIPYPTAWDANHEYMYIPKVIADYHGVIRGNIGPASSLPYLWHGFIGYFFALMKPLNGHFWINADTVAINMNFLSGIFVLLFGLGVLHMVEKFFIYKNENIKKGIFVLGFSSLLLWLTSGMGAFLVFVDNKTDLGVMTLTLLAILGGLVAIHYLIQHNQKDKKIDKELLKYLIVSGMFFAFAAMGKPTAFIDIVVFAVFMVAFGLHSLIGAGIGTILIGFMGVLQPLNAKDFIDPILGKYIILIGFIITIIGVLILLIQKNKAKRKDSWYYLRAIILWGLAFATTLVVFKTPGLLYKYHLSDNLTLQNYTKGLLFTQNTTGTVAKLDTTIISDQKIQKDLNLTHKQCVDINFTEEELTKNLPKIKVGNEDIGRYVGYGREKFEEGDLGYYLFKIFFRKDDTCYGLNTDAKILCKNAEEIDKGNIKKLEEIEALGLLEIGGKAEQLNQKLLEEYKINPETLKYNIEKLRQYYQDHSIYTQKGVVNIPYRYIIPLNINFNWSLQNLSSYYTDIGFVWLIMMRLVVLGLIYGIVTKHKLLRDFAIATTTGWIIWILIGGGIVRYGIGLIVWTIITNIVLFYIFGKEKEHNYIVLSLLGVLFVFFFIQQIMNFLRIGSQGGGKQFIRYKQTIGQENQITTNFQIENKSIFPYTADYLYNLQFGFYQPIIDITDQRRENESLVIAGTYMQYFMKNQKNIIFDTRLGKLSNLLSDGNVCKTYKRLKNKEIKYITLDQNIGTVVMGEGNKSLFYRFFAKHNDKKIQEEGTISMLLKLKKYGYLDLVTTNNLGTKYAFTLPDKDFIQYFKVGSPDQIALLRAKLSVMRFFNKETDLINFVGIMFQRRMNGPAIKDIADMYGKKINEKKVLLAIQLFLKQDIPALKEIILTMDQNDRFITQQVVVIYKLAQTSPQKYKDLVSKMIQNSLFGSTQVVALKIK